MSTFSNHKFLLIDDSEIDSIITSKILQLSGLPKASVTTRSAIKALEFLPSSGLAEFTGEGYSNPLIILLDIHMPDLNAFQFLDEFEKLDEAITEKCRVFLLTSSIDPSDIDRADSNPFVVRVLNKPLNMEELLYYFE